MDDWKWLINNVLLLHNTTQYNNIWTLEGWWNEGKRWELNAMAQIPIAWDNADRFCSTFSKQIRKQFYLECGFPDSWKIFQTIWQVLAIQIFTPPKRLVLYFLHAKIKRKVAIMRKSQEELIPKKFSIIYPFEWRKVTLALPLICILHSETLKPLNLFMNAKRKKGEEGGSMYANK